MKTITAVARAQYEQKGSKFVGLSVPVCSRDAFAEALGGLKKSYKDASHIAYAYRIMEPDGTLRVRAHDAGEPSGTAGKPILAHIMGRDLVNVALVVVRYFGGTKLGAGGLVRAYSHAISDLLQEVEIVEFTQYQTLKVRYSYPDKAALERLVHDHKGEILITEYGSSLVSTIKVDKDKALELSSSLTALGTII